MENFVQSVSNLRGLTAKQVEKRKQEGKANIVTEKSGKSYLRIITGNLFTFFNFVWLLIALALIMCGSFKNLTFLAVVVPNTAIAIIQEIKAKRTVEKLSVTTDPTAKVLRDGELITVNASDIVLGDVMQVEIGKQVLSDAVVLTGTAEVNESMLTGEADAIKKQKGDRILAGSFLVSGSVFAEVINVGKNNYVHKLEKAAKSFKAPSSNLFRDLNMLLKAISILIIPIAPLLAIVNYMALNATGGAENIFVRVVELTSGSIVGMIPAGAYLLVTVTLTLSVITLSKKQTLVQDMYSIEMLASADTVCLDKTGTITDGTMEVVEYHVIDDVSDAKLARIIAALQGCESSLNNTSKALAEKFGRDLSEKKIHTQIPFSSQRKYSAADIEGLGAYSIGAPRFVPCPITAEMDEIITRHANDGHRVILLARHPSSLDEEGVPVALIAISDRIRPAAPETIAKFQEQGVNIKVISGDHAATVSSIAKKVGIKDADKYISCENLADSELIEAANDNVIFGRVTPEQKVLLIKTLKDNGHIVAMTGDGVNDTLALKESNCAIAMADGSEVARKVAQIVLLNSDFASLPDVVREGRRCINNVRSSAVLYLMKTIFSILVALVSIVTISSTPFSPSMMLLTELLIIGFASVLLALEPNDKRIESSFIQTVLLKSFPKALAMFMPAMALMILEKLIPAITPDERSSMSLWAVTVVGLINLAFLCVPYTKWRTAVFLTITALLTAIVPVSMLLLDDFFQFALAFNHPIIFAEVMAGAVILAILIQFIGKKGEAFMRKHFAGRSIFKLLGIERKR